MRDGRRSPALWLGGLAAAGAIAGHHLAYEVASSGAHHKERLLAATGHRYFGWCAALALGVLLAALASFFSSRLRAAGTGERPLRLGLRLVPRLVPVQIGVFLAREAADRVVGAGGGLDGLLAESHVQIGVAIQAAAALCAAGVLAVLASVVDLVARRTGRAPPPRARAARAILPRVQVATIPHVAVRSGTISFRGPPNVP